jgi:hypothetical protein
VRVTSASQGASAHKVSEYLANLGKMKAEEIAKIEGRYSQAVKVFQGKTI